MENLVISALLTAAAFAVGGAIGYAFGLWQLMARLRHEKLERAGKFHNAWKVMPGSGGRVALFLLFLVLVQWLCPLIFTDSIKWWVSGGILLGYGTVLLRQLRQRKAEMR